RGVGAGHARRGARSRRHRRALPHHPGAGGRRPGRPPRQGRHPRRRGRRRLLRRRRRGLEGRRQPPPRGAAGSADGASTRVISGAVPDEASVVSAKDLLRWSEALSGIARTGLGFTKSLYEQERFEEVLKVAADIRVAAGHELESEVLVEEWLKQVGEGVPGYVTPKIAIGAVVGNDEGQILLVQRADSGVWLYPTGWADVGYSASEVAVKEVLEETGIEAEPVRLIAVLDGLRLGFTRIPLYSMVFH